MNPYADAATGTPSNRLGITSRAELSNVEYAITGVRIAELQVQPIKGTLDLEHLRAIHRHVFQDIYEWAGKERTVNFSKRDPNEPGWKSVFARHEQIPAIAQSIDNDLRAFNHLRGLDQADFTNRLTGVYVKLNHLHPFPEGNGRATQTYLSQLALEAGYKLVFEKIDAKDWNHAAARSMPQTNVREPAVTRKEDTTAIHRVFQKIVEPTYARRIENVLGLTVPPTRGREPGDGR